MGKNKVAPATDNSVHIADAEQRESAHNPNQIRKQDNYDEAEEKPCYLRILPSVVHYAVLCILGLLVWLMLWLSFGDGWWWDGPWFRVTFVVVTAWAAGLVFQAVTSLPSFMVALVTGILARHFGYLDMREYHDVEVFLRKIYPVIILGKGSLTWDTNYMKEHWQQVAALGVMPWIADVVTLATCTHFFLGHPWIWGFTLGAFYSSGTTPVVMPNVIKAGSRPKRTQVWPQFVCTAGGIDTGLSVGVAGILLSFLFSDPADSEVYRYLRVITSLFLGVAVGVAWGRLADFLPHSSDLYFVELRVLFVVIGGLALRFSTVHLGWTGLACVAVLACNSTAATYWAKTGWTLNNNPASTAYRVIWSTCEPTVFACTGTYFVLKNSTYETLIYGFAIFLLSQVVRLSVAFIMCWNLSLREKLFICCVWSTKSIVEVVLAPVALIMLMGRGHYSSQEMRYAEDFVVLIVQEVLIATPFAFLTTKYLGPILLRDKSEYNDDNS